MILAVAAFRNTIKYFLHNNDGRTDGGFWHITHHVCLEIRTPYALLTQVCFINRSLDTAVVNQLKGSGVTNSRTGGLAVQSQGFVHLSQ